MKLWEALLAAAVLLAAIPGLAFAESDANTEYDRLAAEARSHDCGYGRPQEIDRQKAIDLYFQAVEEDPDNPQNVDLLLRVGQLYICNFNTNRGRPMSPKKPWRRSREPLPIGRSAGMGSTGPTS
ncbi:MAG: hypothetical protein NTW86_30635 [Candidatus Sumerlaeota bacterium]|nr:hypothetical protein [Candidatus Sumerlaeota bacterium]